MRRELTLDLYLDGAWHHAGGVVLYDADLGWQGGTNLDYTMDHCLAYDPDFTGAVAGVAAFGVGLGLSLDWHRFPTWPPFLLDMLPQGHARQVLAQTLGLNQDAASSDTPLLLRAGGGPIGNVRIREAWEAEQARIAGVRHPGLPIESVFARNEFFTELAADFAALASGSSGVQGAWPKMLLTRNTNDRWLPDPMVPDAEATDHAIVKWAGDGGEATRLILAAEAPYLELARAFGLRCARKLEHHDGMLLIPRFDRRVENRGVVRVGQESIVSASGVAAFGHYAAHEDYLAVLKRHCTDPAAEVTEYVLRDLLNLAAGNPDNHGRNTALAKEVDGSIRLTPLFDFCPMRMSPDGIARSTRWACMRTGAGPSRDLDPDWDAVCTVAAAGVMNPAALRDVLATKADLLRRLPETARALGVPDKVIERCMGHCDALAESVV